MIRRDEFIGKWYGHEVFLSADDIILVKYEGSVVNALSAGDARRQISILRNALAAINAYTSVQSGLTPDSEETGGPAK